MTSKKQTLPENPETIVDTVRDRYGKIVTAGSSCCGPQESSCCGSPTPDAVATILGYDSVDLNLLPDNANLGLGCGTPLQHLELKSGETVLDLGSGAGIDALIAGRSVGPTGRVIGVDMTPEMLSQARRNAVEAGMPHVEFREGRLEELPVEASSVDAVTSNCVINLVPDKMTVFREIARVLRPGGRLAISDIVLDRELPKALQQDVLSYVGCVAGAMQREAYFAMLREAGFTHISVLSDSDFLALTQDALPAEVSDILKQNDIKIHDVRGIVRSVTYRAKLD